MEIRDTNRLTEKEFLAQYRPGDYERPSVATDMVIFTAKACQEDNYRKLPKKKFDNIYLEQLYTFSDPHRDPRMWVMSCAYMALVDSEKINVSAGDDAKSAEWFDVSLKTEHTDINETANGFISVTDYILSLQKDNELLKSVSFVEEYKGKQILKGKKSVTLRLVIGSDTKTLTSAELEKIGFGVAKCLEDKYSALLRR